MTTIEGYHRQDRDAISEGLEEATIINHKFNSVTFALIEKRARVYFYPIYVFPNLATGIMEPHRWTDKVAFENVTIVPSFRQDLKDARDTYSAGMREWQTKHDVEYRDFDIKFKYEYYDKRAAAMSAWREANPEPTLPDYS